MHRDGRDGHLIAATRGPEWYRSAFGAPFVGLHRADLQRLLADAVGPEHLFLECRVEALEEHDGGMRVRCWPGAAFDANIIISRHRRALADPGLGDWRRRAGLLRHVGIPQASRQGSVTCWTPGALQFWVGPGAHLLHYPICGGELINFLAVIDAPARWVAPGWMEPAEPGAHLEAFAGSGRPAGGRTDRRRPPNRRAGACSPAGH